MPQALSILRVLEGCLTRMRCVVHPRGLYPNEKAPFPRRCQRCAARHHDHTEARLAVFQFIEGFYNPSRRHSALAYLSPIEYEGRRDGLIKPS